MQTMQTLTPLLLLFLLLSTANTTSAQAPAAAPAAPAKPAPAADAPAKPAPSADADAPAPPGPSNITGILAKAGQFTMFTRLLKATTVLKQIYNQLNFSSNGMTVFAPTDNAFSSLPSGTLNSLSEQQKDALIQFHVLPQHIAMSQFDTVSNPLRTQAGDNSPYQYPLNVTSEGTQVNISTGVVNATVDNTLYSDDQLVVYQVNKVLLPMAIYGPSAPAPAPLPQSKKKRKAGSSVADAPDADVSTDEGSTPSAAGRLTRMGSFGCGIEVALALFGVWWGL